MPIQTVDLFDRARAAAKRALGIEDEETAAAEMERQARQTATQAVPSLTPSDFIQQTRNAVLDRMSAERTPPPVTAAPPDPAPMLQQMERGPGAKLFDALGVPSGVTDALGAASDVVADPLAPDMPALERTFTDVSRAFGPAGTPIQNTLGAAVRSIPELLRGTVQPVDPDTGMANIDIPGIPGPDEAADAAKVAGNALSDAGRTMAGASADVRKMRGVEATIDRADLAPEIKDRARAYLDAAREIVPQVTVPQAEDVIRAADIPLEALNRIKPGDKLDRPMLYRASARVKDLTQEAARLELSLADLSEEAALPVRAKLDVIKGEAVRLLGAVDPSVSESGRNLAFTKVLLKDLDPDRMEQQALAIARSRRPGRLAGADEFEVRKAVAEVRGAKTPEEREAALVKLSRAVSTQKLGFFESIAAVRKAGLLTGFTTHFRNVGGNTGFQGAEMVSQNVSYLVEAGLATLGKDKTVKGSFTTPTVIRETLAGAGQGFKDIGAILKQGATAEDLARYDFASEIRTTLGPASPLADKAINWSFRALSAGDRPFRVSALKRSMATQAEAAAKNAGLAGGAKKAFIDGFIKQPPEEAQIQALMDSEFAVFANRNAVSSAWQRLRSEAPDPVKALMDQFIPFTKTPTNVVARVLDYSGVPAVYKGATMGSIQNLAPEQRKAFADAMGRGATGWAMMSLGYWLAEKGVMTGPRSAGDAGERNVEEAADMPGGSVKMVLEDNAVKTLLGFGGKDNTFWVDTATMAPTGAMMAIGAAMYEADVKELGKKAAQGFPAPKTVSGVLAGAAGGANALLGQSMLSGSEQIISALRGVKPDNTLDPNYDPEKGAKVRLGQFLGKQGASYIPSIFAMAGRAMDPYRRDTYNASEQTIDVLGVPVDTAPIKERIPFLREELQPQIDARGESIASNPLEALLPVRVSDAPPDAVAAARNFVNYSAPREPREGESDAEFAVRVSDTNRYIYQTAVLPLLGSDGGSVVIGNRVFHTEPGMELPERTPIIQAAIAAARRRTYGKVFDPRTGEWVKPAK